MMHYLQYKTPQPSSHILQYILLSCAVLNSRRYKLYYFIFLGFLIIHQNKGCNDYRLHA